MRFRERTLPRPKETILALLGVGMMALTVVACARLLRAQKPMAVTFSPGGKVGVRLSLLRDLPRVAAGHGLSIRTQIVTSSEGLALVDDGQLDFAFIQGGLDLSRHRNVRLVLPMFVETMHLLVKEELVPEVSAHLGALRGKTVLLGVNTRTAGHRLSRALLEFIGLRPEADGLPGDYRGVSFPLDRLSRKVERKTFPDAILLMSIPPAVEVNRIVTECRYRLVALPIARAFTMSAHLGGEPAQAERPEGAETIRRENVFETAIPAYTYLVDPAVPPADLPTLGTRSLMITHRGLAPEAVDRMLQALFDDRFSRAFNPPLEPSLLEMTPEAPLHPGAVRFRDRGKPLVTGELVGVLANAVTIGAPLIGTVLFVWQWSRQFARRRNAVGIDVLLKRVGALEDRAVTLELAPVLDFEGLAALQAELGRLKSEALDLFARGRVQGAGQLSDFLALANDARDYLSRLIAQGREGRPAPAPGWASPGRADSEA